MEQLIEFFRELWSSDAFMPRWVCGEWSELHGWTYIISDVIIFLAYMAIPTTMLIFVRRRWEDVPFKPVFWLYILFILLCGITHLIDAVIFYEPIYRVNALVLALTAVVSVITAGAMIYVLPRALSYTSPKQLELVVDQKTTELKEQVKTLDELTQRVSRKKNQLEQFAYITSHNLRTPVTNLRSLIVLFKEARSEDDKTAILEKIAESSSVMMNTIDDVSRVVTHSSPQLDSTEVSFQEYIQQILNQHESELQKINHEIDLDLKVERIMYPPDHFRNIVQNLIENAIKYRKKNNLFKLNLKTFTHEGRVVFVCEDNGVGIDLERDGDKVFKLHKTIGKDNEGSGIGLFLVQNQLENLDGFITLESEVGEGSKFTVTFGDVEN